MRQRHYSLRSTLFALSSGFTMIELLVVIAIIGILAVAVLSTLNPIEQLNRGRDTRSRADASEMLAGSERYYTVNEIYPWNAGAAGGAADPVSSYEFDGRTGSWAWAQELVTSNEVKSSLINRLTTDKKHVIFKAAGAAETPYVCFKPVSTSLQSEAAKNCTAGVTPATTPGGVDLCGTVGSQWLCLP